VLATPLVVSLWSWQANAKIMNGLKAWNHVVGISAGKNNRLIVRSVSSGPKRNRIALLFIGRPEQTSRNEQNKKRDNGAPLIRDVAANRRR
jgi:hypothetical protein